MAPNIESTHSLVPENPLEVAIVQGKAGQITLEATIDALLENFLYIPSITEVQPDGKGFTPVLVQTSPAEQFVIAFSAHSRAETVQDRAKFCIRLPGHQMISRIPPGFGLILNPGFRERVDITAPGILDLKNKPPRPQP